MKKVVAGFLLACMFAFSGCGGGGTTSPSATTTAATSFLAWTGSSDPSNEFQLVRINSQNGQVTNIGGFDFLPALVYGPDGTLYGVGDHLAIVNPANGSTNRIGGFMFGGSGLLMTSAAFSPDGKLYVVENDTPHRIFSVDLTNADLTLVGTPSAIMRPIAFSSNGTLYAAFGNLFALNPTDASTKSTIGTISSYSSAPSPLYINSMTFGEDANLYGIDVFPSTVLCKLDVSTAVAYPVTSLASGNVVAIVAERSVAVKSKTALSQQLHATPHRSRAELLAMENQLKAEAPNR